VITKTGLESLKERDHLENLGVVERINIKMSVTKTGWEDVDQIHLAPDRDQWQHLVNNVMNLQFA
jgi:hypothetical protein